MWFTMFFPLELEFGILIVPSYVRWLKLKGVDLGFDLKGYVIRRGRSQLRRGRRRLRDLDETFKMTPVSPSTAPATPSYSLGLWRPK